MAGSPLRILWVDIDSLRPDHLGCHGYPRSTSPNIDALAAEGARFDRLYTSDSPCLPFSEGLRRGFRSPRAHGSLAAVLSRAGLWTTTISVFGQHHSALHWYAGFNEAIQDGYRTWSAEGVGRHALDWLERNADRDRWFLHVHVWDPHTPYTGTPEDAEALGDGRPDWVTDEVLARHRAQGGPHSASEVLGFGNSPLSRSPSFPLLPDSLESLEDVARAFDGYDTGVRRADALVGRLLDALAAQGVAEDQWMMRSYYREDITGIPEMGVVAEQLWAASGVGPSDVQTAMLYDHFTPLVLPQFEEFGFCGRGEARDFIADGNIEVGGGLPVNTSGGQLGEAYIHGMNGIAEAVRQVRGTSVNQVAGTTNVLVTSGSGVPTSGLLLSSEGG